MSLVYYLFNSSTFILLCFILYIRLVLNRVRTPGALRQFEGAGYRYDKAASSPDTPVFVRSFNDRVGYDSP